jgi:hypothetical protein
MSQSQLDFFASQADLSPREPVSYAPDPSRVRGKLNAVLCELQSADTMPWDRKKIAYHRQLFPQMTRCLPQDEAETLKLAFESEMRRLLAA